MVDIPFGIYFILRLLAFTEDTNGIVGFAPTAGTRSVTLEQSDKFTWEVQ